MSQLVDLSNGQRLEFPDGMTDDQMHVAIQKEYPMHKYQQAQNEEQPGLPESTGVTGVASDAIASLLKNAFAIPGALLGLPGEGIGAAKQVFTDPQRAAQNVGGGFGELGHGILSAPANIRDYLLKKKLMSPLIAGLLTAQAKTNPSYNLMKDLPKEYNYPEALGRQGEQSGDALLTALPKIATAAPFEAGLFNALKEIPFTRGLAAKPYKQATKIVKEQGIKNITIPNNLIKEAKDFLPKNAATKDLLKKANLGDYDAIHTLQSDLGGVSRELRRFFSTGSDRLRGLDAEKLRTSINDSFKKQLEKSGHQEVAELRGKGAKKYRTYHKYVKPAQKVALGVAASNIPGFSLFHKLHNLLNP